MNLIDRAKNMLLAAKSEWPKVNSEPGSLSTVLPGYTIPLAAIGSAALIVSIGLIGVHGQTNMKAGLLGALFLFLCVVLTVVGAIYVADGIATSMGAQKNINKSAQWVAYGFTPLYVILLLSIIPMTDRTIVWLIIIVGFAFSGYIMFQGAPLIKGTPPDKAVAYTAAVIIISIILYIILDKISEKILVSMLRPKVQNMRDFEDLMRQYR
jgi:hypothetical protein